MAVIFISWDKLRDGFPTEYFTAPGPKHSSINASDQYKICQSTTFVDLKL